MGVGLFHDLALGLCINVSVVGTRSRLLVDLSDEIHTLYPGWDPYYGAVGGKVGGDFNLVDDSPSVIADKVDRRTSVKFEIGVECALRGISAGMKNYTLPWAQLGCKVRSRDMVLLEV